MEASTERANGAGGALLAEVKAVMLRAGLTQRQVARESGTNSGAVSSWLKGKYAGDVGRLEGKLAKWLRLHEAKAGSQDFSLDVHVPGLSNTRLVGGALRHAQLAADMVCLYGGAGGGKTHAARHYAERYSNVHIVTGEPALCSLSAVLRRVAVAVGAAEGTCAVMSDAIAAALAGSKALLVVDEAHHLSQRIFDQLRCVYDKINAEGGDFGLAFLGNEPLMRALTAGPAMKQIYSRLGVCEPLPSPPAPDGAELLGAIVGSEPSDQGALWAAAAVAGIGGYRALVKAARRAVLRTGKPIRDLTERDILETNAAA